MKVQEIKKQVDILEPFLKQTAWAPTTSMLIPSFLNKTDKLLKKIETSDDTGIKEQYKRLKKLRKNFKRDSKMTAGEEFSKLRFEYLHKHKGAADPATYLAMGFGKLIEILKNAKGRKIIFTPIEGTTGGQKITYE